MKKNLLAVMIIMALVLAGCGKDTSPAISNISSFSIAFILRTVKLPGSSSLSILHSYTSISEVGSSKIVGSSSVRFREVIADDGEADAEIDGDILFYDEIGKYPDYLLSDVSYESMEEKAVKKHN